MPAGPESASLPALYLTPAWPWRCSGDDHPAKIRGLTLLLASSASSFTTGAVYPVDGGQLLQSLPLPPPSL